MCEICHRFPCLSRCPNAEEAVAAKCYECGRDIYEGEDAYKIGDEIFCEDCVKYGRFVAEAPEPDYD